MNATHAYLAGVQALLAELGEPADGNAVVYACWFLATTTGTPRFWFVVEGSQVHSWEIARLLRELAPAPPAGQQLPQASRQGLAALYDFLPRDRVRRQLYQRALVALCTTPAVLEQDATQTWLAQNEAARHGGASPYGTTYYQAVAANVTRFYRQWAAGQLDNPTAGEGQALGSGSGTS